MSEASIGRRQEELAKTSNYAFSEFSQEAWAAQKVIGRPLDKQPERSLPELKITSESTEGNKAHAKGKHSESARDLLLRNLEAKFGKDSSEDLKKYMEQFEKRASANQLSKYEVTETYQQINRILSATGEKPLTPELRHQIAREMLHHCATPEIISQGGHNTCNATSVEVRTYSLHPSKAAKLMADMATKGEYTTPTGIKVKVDSESITPDREARISAPAKNFRDYATQLFNLTAINVWYSAVKPGMHYEQRIENDSHTHREKVIERVMDYSSGKGEVVSNPFTKRPLDGPFLSADQIAFISDNIVGKHEPYAVLTFGTGHSLYLPGEKKQLVHAADIGNESHFQTLLQHLKDTHQLPAIAEVQTGIDPINEDQGSSLFGYENGGHVINITDFVAGKDPHVSIDNEWSQKEDHLSNSVSAHDIYLCIGGLDTAMNDAALNVLDAEYKHTEAPVDEMRKQALLAGYGSGPDAQYAKDAAQIVTKLAASEKKLSGEDRHKWFSALHSVLNSTNPEDKVGLLQSIQKSGACTPAELGWLVADSAISISHSKQVAYRNADANRKRICISANRQIAEFVIGLPPEVKKHYFQKLRENY
ncbi:MAG: hypothetical protein K2X27_22300 [Candidatus Obscuribacterales bacterium]|nr:hypothetical protein [Candidatus Obscuribacterales bacterium]